jgi:hypothetical protein
VSTEELEYQKQKKELSFKPDIKKSQNSYRITATKSPKLISNP